MCGALNLFGKSRVGNTQKVAGLRKSVRIVKRLLNEKPPIKGKKPTSMMSCCGKSSWKFCIKVTLRCTFFLSKIALRMVGVKLTGFAGGAQPPFLLLFALVLAYFLIMHF
ncbi:hypothetical protein AB990_01245 [Alkalihalobacillus pseudalcaliphilus]|nr:hypothetical protein AB990_01245 [Alkalihalobacillus pseudalcaliphilus]